MKAKKGSEFERFICKLLSKWWTHDLRDDVFWRSSQSGGRATERAKKGLTTSGSYGDITAIDFIGEPLLKFATIELKRGSTHGSAWDIFESAKTRTVRPFEKALNQARRSAEEAGSLGWMLIVKRDQKLPILYLDWKLHYLLGISVYPSIIHSLSVNQPEAFAKNFRFIAFHLEDWLRQVAPKRIINAVNEKQKMQSKKLK